MSIHKYKKYKKKYFNLINLIGGNLTPKDMIYIRDINIKKINTLLTEKKISISNINDFVSIYPNRSPYNSPENPYTYNNVLLFYLNGLLRISEITKDHISILENLINIGADVNLGNPKFPTNTPIKLSLQMITKNEHIFEYLINKGARIDSTDLYFFIRLLDHNNSMPINDAIINIIKIFLSKNINLNNYKNDKYATYLKEIIRDKIQLINNTSSNGIITSSNGNKTMDNNKCIGCILSGGYYN